MKQRILLTLVTLFALLTGANAQSPYGLQICGVDVTDDNKANLIAVINSVDGCSATGTMSYDSDSKTLTLNGVTADFGTRDGITSSQALTINLVGSNSLKSTNSVIYNKLSDLTVQGSGSLVLESTNSYGIECNYGTEPAHTLTFKETNVEIKGYGLSTSGDVASKLVIDKSSVKASSIPKFRSTLV